MGHNNYDLSWGKHVSYVVNKANKVLGVIKRSLGNDNLYAFSCFFKSLVRPILEYVTLPPSGALEKVQRRASRLALKQKRGEMSYEDRCRLLNWQTLEKRRELLSLVLEPGTSAQSEENQVSTSTTTQQNVFTVQQIQPQAIFAGAHIDKFEGCTFNINVFCSFLYFFYHSSCRKDQFTFLILKFGVKVMVDLKSLKSDCLKAQRAI